MFENKLDSSTDKSSMLSTSVFTHKLTVLLPLTTKPTVKVYILTVLPRYVDRLIVCLCA